MRAWFRRAAPVALAPFLVHAQQPMERMTVTATRIPEAGFDVPAAIDTVGASVIREDNAQVNLSEALGRVPGIVVQNRQNYAQDLQISSRGFGSRSTFGVRGVRLIADGIPATMPDGQGQASGVEACDSVASPRISTTALAPRATRPTAIATTARLAATRRTQSSGTRSARARSRRS